MSKPTNLAETFVHEDIVWERFNYGPGDNRFQRACDAEGCDRGLIYAPVRYCGRCGGDGWLVQSTDPRRVVEGSGPQEHK